MNEEFDYDWHNVVKEYLEEYTMDDGNLAEFIDSLVPIHYNDIWDVAQKHNLGHTIISEMSLHPEMTVYTLLQGAIIQVYYSEFTQALIDMGIPELE